MHKRIILLLMILLFITGCGKKIETVTIHEYYCEEGKVEDNKCVINTSIEPESIECEDDSFEFNEETRNCEYINAFPAQKEYYCNEGYTLTNGKCVNDETGESEYRQNSKYVCPYGRVNGSNCEIVDTREVIFTCPDGYTKNEDKVMCEKTEYAELKERTITEEVEE